MLHAHPVHCRRCHHHHTVCLQEIFLLVPLPISLFGAEMNSTSHSCRHMSCCSLSFESLSSNMFFTIAPSWRNDNLICGDYLRACTTTDNKALPSTFPSDCASSRAVLRSNKPVFVAVTHADVVNNYTHNYQHQLTLGPQMISISYWWCICTCSLWRTTLIQIWKKIIQGIWYSLLWTLDTTDNEIYQKEWTCLDTSLCREGQWSPNTTTAKTVATHLIDVSSILACSSSSVIDVSSILTCSSSSRIVISSIPLAYSSSTPVAGLLSVESPWLVLLVAGLLSVVSPWLVPVVAGLMSVVSWLVPVVAGLLSVVFPWLVPVVAGLLSVVSRWLVPVVAGLLSVVSPWLVPVVAWLLSVVSWLVHNKNRSYTLDWCQ